MPFVDTYFGAIVNRPGILPRGRPVRVTMPNHRPFSRHVALHVSVTRCLYGPRRRLMSTANWPGIDDLDPPVNPALNSALAQFKIYIAHCLTTNSPDRIPPKIIRLPQGLTREDYIYMGEKLAANLEEFDAEIYGSLMLIAINPMAGLIPFTVLHQNGWNYNDIFGNEFDGFPIPEELPEAVVLQIANELAFTNQHRFQPVKIEDSAIECPLNPDEPKLTCSICITEIVDNNGELKCGHSFHVPCIQDWLSRCGNCPMCRRRVKLADYTDADGPDSSKKPKVEGEGSAE